ncbi:MAG: hypothetical protein IJ754_02805 [Bacteroidaceae bacterium]|nr:hypothetical protein [Bacteroidaceae bacterium]
MKKWFSMFALFLLAGFSSASAQQLVIDDVQLKAGETAELTVKLASGAITVYGFQTDIVLPEALTMEVAPKGVAASMADDTDPAFSVNQQADGAYRIAAFSLGGAAFKPETAVATFTVKAAEDFSNVNGAYVGIALKNTKYTVDSNGTEVAGATTGNVVDAGLYTYPVRPVTIGFEDTPSVPAGIVTYAADREGLQVSGMQPVRGWTAASNGDARAAGVFDAGSATSFLGSTGFYAPATNPDGLTPKMLGILAVWTATAQYKQNVFLKAGEYYMTVNVYNAGGTTAIAKNLIGFVAEDGTEYFAETTEYPVGEWKTEQIRIVLPEDTYGAFSLGYTAQDASKTDMPHLFFDGVNFSNEIFPNNFRAYHFTSKRGGLGVRSTLVTVANGEEAQYNIFAAEATDFAVVTYNEKTYLYSINDKKFVKEVVSNALVTTNYDPQPFDISEWPAGGYHFIFGGNTLNINNSNRGGYVINSWAYADAGNQIQVESVGDFDPTEALAILAAPEAAPAVTATPVANLAGLSNAKAYAINGVRSLYWGVTANSVACNPVLLPNEEKEQFAVLQAAGNYYLYSIAAKKFLDRADDNNFKLVDEPAAVEIVETGNADYPFLFRYGTFTVNYNGTSASSKITIDGWSSQDDGNRYAISEVGDFDASAVMALLPQELGDGDYVFQNCETGQFLFGANDWNTKASLIPFSQHLTLHKLEDGRFNIESQQNNGGESYWVGWGDINAKNSIFVDCDIARAIAFTIEPVGEGIYSMMTDTDLFLASEEGTTVVAMIEDGAAEAAKWRIVPATMASLAAATEENPVNATFLIKAAGFDRNNRNAAAWTMTASNQNLCGGTNENKVAESWHSTFELKQTIANAPKGVYRLSANAFYRDDSNGALTKLPVLYANEFESEFPQVEDGTLADGRKYRDQGVLQMSDASNWFFAGQYPVAPVFFELAADGDITVGVKYDQPEQLWAIWDNFNLVYYGPDADITSVQIEGRDAILDELYDKAVDLADDGYPEEITIALGHAIETADDVKALVPPTKEAYDKAIAELQEAIAAADAYTFPATEMSVDFNFVCGEFYQGAAQSVDVAAILAELGVPSIDAVVIAAVQPDGTYDTNYKLGTTDGWRNAEGAWQGWGADARFYVKADFTLPENQLYEVGGMDGQNLTPATYVATYSFKAGKREVLLKVNVIFAEKVLTEQEQYDLALAEIKDGTTYRIFTEVGGVKYYLNEDGALTAELDDAGVFKFEKVAGVQWENGFWLKSSNCFSNPSNADSFNTGSLNKYTSARRSDWEAQVFFNDGNGNYAVRSTNAAYATSSWGLLGSAYWAVYEGEEGPTAGYSYDKANIWQIEEYVDERLAAFEMVQAWPYLFQDKLGLVKDAEYYISNAKDPEEGSYEALLDNDYTTFFHSSWHASMDPGEDHYLEAEMTGFVDEFYFYFKKRSQNNNNRPTKIVVSASKNGTDYVEVATIEEGLPTEEGVIFYQSEDFKLDGAYKYIRFTVPSTNNGATTGEHVFFTFSEFYILKPSDLITAASEYYGIASYRDLTPSDVEAIKALDEQIKKLGDDGINGVNAGFNFDDNAVYDLSGRKVQKAQKGIYIVNGKKVMVK